MKKGKKFGICRICVTIDSYQYPTFNIIVPPSPLLKKFIKKHDCFLELMQAHPLSESDRIQNVKKLSTLFFFLFASFLSYYISYSQYYMQLQTMLIISLHFGFDSLNHMIKWTFLWIPFFMSNEIIGII